MSKLSGLARVHPKDVQLVGAVAVRKKGDALAVGRPNGLTVAPCSTGQLSHPCTVDIHNPKITDALIFNLVNPGSGEHDLSSVGRDRRIADALHIHESFFGERAFSGLAHCKQAKREQKKQHKRAGAKKRESHRRTSYAI